MPRGGRPLADPANPVLLDEITSQQLELPGNPAHPVGHTMEPVDLFRAAARRSRTLAERGRGFLGAH
jgi:hypothetical protein